jgi:hypothetical protein
MKYVQGTRGTDKNPTLEQKTIEYNRNGVHALDGEKIFAKTVVGSKQPNFFVLTWNNSIYDPLGVDSHRENLIRTELKKTSQKTLNSYLEYLRTNNKIYITQAQRSYING